MKRLSLSMLPFETDVLLGEVTKNCHRVMPKVVPDQRSKFDNDELFRKLSREGEIKYTGFKDRPLEERQLRFQTECREGHADLAFVATGINLQLQFTPNAWSENPDDRVPTPEFVNFDREPGKVHLKSQFILNGVCVIWKGWVDLSRLDGIGSIEYDAERAMVEDNLLRQQMDQYQRQLQDFENRQRHYREEQERRAEAEAEEYHRFIRNRVEMFGKSHPWFLLGLDRGKRRLPSVESTSSTEETDSGKRRLSSIETSTALPEELDKKKIKRSESIVQVPVPVKPIAGGTSLLSLGTGLAMSAAARLHPPRHTLSSHTATSAILGHSLHVGDTMTTRAPIATRSHLVTSCPVKLYPWKPNMYLV
ncbi:protein big brother-like isoform X1 [Mercenaria mercenaria]|uniref:protein big brother-like isoform X1 n=1 Tax=Mercenaria mercenaria TaxID=6596 RepID=UPI001E1DB457|nr:protein big brother-like isoform X1 [Mercenaria mercenaria]